MQSIDILTSQNVTITYTLAPLRERIFAFFIDMVVLVVSMLIIVVVLSTVIQLRNQNVYILFYFIASSFYMLVSEILMDGQSIGKKAAGIKVVKLEGIEPSLNDYLIRWAFRPIDIWLSIGVVGCMLINSSSKNQRLGDLIANTTLIKTASDQRMNLNDVLSITSLENYEPVYTNVTSFSEQEMLLIKEVMDRNSKHKNAAHQKALDDTVAMIKERLELKEIPGDKNLFIKTLIRDFVTLSR